MIRESARQGPREAATTPTAAAADRPAAAVDGATWLADRGPGDILMTPDGWMLDANRPATLMLRLPEGQEPRGLNFRRFCRQPARLAEMVETIKTAGVIGGWDGDLTAFDGQPVHAVVNIAGVFENGVLTAVRAQTFDITEWHTSRERDLFGQRIEAIGRLAGGVAHDFNNLLTIISGHAECLSLSIASDSPMNRSVAAIQASSARAASLTQKLLAFGRRQALQPRVVEMNDLVGRVEADLRRTFGHRVSISSEVAPPACRVRIDPGQTERAVATIATHAIDAMPDRGALTLRVTHADIGPEWSPARDFVKPGLFARLDVTAVGMTLDTDAQIRMFEPFFREKGATRDGMSLAAVFGLVKQSGGHLWVEGQRNNETTFTMLLPAEPGDLATPVTMPEPSTSARASVLVVDDDGAVRGLIVKILEHQGYSVLEAASVATGLRLSQTRPIDLLISNPELDSAHRDLASTLLQARPQMRLLNISPYVSDEPVARALDERRVAFLERPFSAAQLIERVSTLLAW